jgi:hypothetical protein
MLQDNVMVRVRVRVRVRVEVRIRVEVNWGYVCGASKVRVRIIVCKITNGCYFVN